jgi:hypothetical protein
VLQGKKFFLFAFRGIAGVLPRVEASFEDGHVFEADISKPLCRTGT